MMYDLGAMSTCGLSSTVADDKKTGIMFATDYVNTDAFTSLEAELNKLEKF